MSYCRFSDGDVYMYPNIYGGIECCSCTLAEKIKTVFTTELKEEDFQSKIFGILEPCEYCGGEGCDACMMHGNLSFYTRSEAIAHLKSHIENGDYVPSYAIEALEEELIELGETEGIEIPTEEVSPFIDIKTGKMLTFDDDLKEFKELQ